MTSLHPGEVLLHEYLKPRHICQTQCATDTYIPAEQLTKICLEQSPITADIAIRLAIYLGTTAQYWLVLQNDHDLMKAHKLSDDEFATIVPFVL